MKDETTDKYTLQDGDKYNRRSRKYGSLGWALRETRVWVWRAGGVGGCTEVLGKNSFPPASYSILVEGND